LCGDKAWREPSSDSTTSHDQHVKTLHEECGTQKAMNDVNGETVSNANTKSFIYINGIYLVNECITLEQEMFLSQHIDLAPWSESQSGRRKQDYGPKVNFKKKKCKIGQFVGLPSYIRSTFESLKEKHGHILDDFQPVELCNLDYHPSRGSHIDPHIDDTLTRRNEKELNKEEAIEIDIEMAPRSLLVLFGEARYDWLHSIKRINIKERRLATTLRELTPRFLR
jgi:alkylated DNA repair protein alkB family protein 4